MKDYSKYYTELNKSQKLAVDTIDGPVLVLAGPGTGKTQLLSVRAASILKMRKVEPENILILTYTNSAAKEMKERLARIMGLLGYDVAVSTLHSFANSIIQDSEEAANYVGDKIQMDTVEQVKAIEHILDHTKGIDELRPFRAPYLYLDDILKRIGEFKRDGITPGYFKAYMKNKINNDTYLEEKHIKRLNALSIIYNVYEELKEGRDGDIFDDRGRYDFDDMILFATEAIVKENSLKTAYQERFKYVMVDEFQDTNGAQLELLFALLDYNRPNLCCVGDDDQSIYRFQGASVGNFKLLMKRFPGINVISLIDNYRSSDDLIALSTTIINTIPLKERTGQKILNPTKKYRDKFIDFREFSSEDEELIYIIDQLKELKRSVEKSAELNEEERSHPYNNISILVRKRAHILKIIDALLQAGIPYATDGKEDISGEKRVKQLLDVLELAHIDPGEYELKDLALYKILTADYFEIPITDIFRFISYVNLKKLKDRSANFSLLVEFLDCFTTTKKCSIKFEKPQKVREAAGVIKRLLDDAPTRSVHSILLDFIKEAGIFKHILREYADKDVLRIRELRALTSFVDMVKSADLARPAISLDEFMSEIKTRKDHGLPIQGRLVTTTQDGVRILTAHGSKGMEFHSVIIPFCLQNKNWPARAIPDKIPVPSDLFKTKEKITDKIVQKQLFLQDEIRLFYVAITRAKSNLIFTASPGEESISSSYLANLGPIETKMKSLEEESILKKFLNVTDLKDPLIGTESVVADLIKNLTLNPTRLNNYLLCRRRFFYNDVLKLPAAKKKSLVFGNCVHKALEDTYTVFKKTGKFPAFQFFREAFEKELKFQGPDKSIEAHCLGEEQMNKLRNWFDITSKNPVLPIGLERKLLITIGDNIIFTGKYDKVEWADEKKGYVKILDYKTGKPDKHLTAINECSDLRSDSCDGYMRQLVAYKLLFEKDKNESKGRKATSGGLVFIEPVSADLKKIGYKKGDYVTKLMEISDDMAKEMEKLIIDVWEDISLLKFEKLKEREKDKCGNCDFDMICWK